MEPRERYRSRRHWFELVAEISDFIWWTIITSMIVFAIADLVDQAAGWFMLVCLWPLGPLFKELVLWNAEQYVIIDLPTGKTILRKEFNILNWERTIEDDVNYLAPITLSSPFGRYLGYQSVQLSSVNKVYFTGQRVPVELLQEMRKSRSRADKEQFENERAMVVSKIDTWMRSGLIDIGPARAVVQALVEDNL